MFELPEETIFAFYDGGKLLALYDYPAGYLVTLDNMKTGEMLYCSWFKTMQAAEFVLDKMMLQHFSYTPKY